MKSFLDVNKILFYLAHQIKSWILINSALNYFLAHRFWMEVEFNPQSVLGVNTFSIYIHIKNWVWFGCSEGMYFYDLVFGVNMTHTHTHTPHTHTLTDTHSHTHTTPHTPHTHTHTHTHTHVGFYGLRGLSIGVMVFILYKLYVLLPYTYPTPKLSPHRRRCISTFPQKTHTVWFISILNYGDTENVLINHLLL